MPGSGQDGSFCGSSHFSRRFSKASAAADGPARGGECLLDPLGTVA